MGEKKGLRDLEIERLREKKDESVRQLTDSLPSMGKIFVARGKGA